MLIHKSETVFILAAFTALMVILSIEHSAFCFTSVLPLITVIRPLFHPLQNLAVSFNFCNPWRILLLAVPCWIALCQPAELELHFQVSSALHSSGLEWAKRKQFSQDLQGGNQSVVITPKVVVARGGDRHRGVNKFQFVLTLPYSALLFFITDRQASGGQAMQTVFTVE